MKPNDFFKGSLEVLGAKKRNKDKIDSISNRIRPFKIKDSDKVPKNLSSSVEEIFRGELNFRAYKQEDREENEKFLKEAKPTLNEFSEVIEIVGNSKEGNNYCISKGGEENVPKVVSAMVKYKPSSSWSFLKNLHDYIFLTDSLQSVYIDIGNLMSSLEEKIAIFWAVIFFGKIFVMQLRN